MCATRVYTATGRDHLDAKTWKSQGCKLIIRFRMDKKMDEVFKLDIFKQTQGDPSEINRWKRLLKAKLREVEDKNRSNVSQENTDKKYKRVKVSFVQMRWLWEGKPGNEYYDFEEVLGSK